MAQTHFKKDALRIVSTSVSLLPFLTTLCKHLGRQETNCCCWINTILKYFLSYFFFHNLPFVVTELQLFLTRRSCVFWWFFLGCFEVFERFFFRNWLLFDHFHQQGDSQTKCGMFSACSAMCCFEKTVLDKWRTKVEVAGLKYYLEQRSRFWKSCP